MVLLVFFAFLFAVTRFLFMTSLCFHLVVPSTFFAPKQEIKISLIIIIIIIKVLVELLRFYILLFCFYRSCLFRFFVQDEDLVDDTLEDVPIETDEEVAPLAADTPPPPVDFEDNDGYDDGYDTPDDSTLGGDSDIESSALF